MKIIFLCTRSITFNTFLKSQANYLKKKGFKVIIACSDTENLNFNKNSRYKINFKNNLKGLLNFFNYFKVFFQIQNLIKENPHSLYYLHTPIASHIFRIFTIFNKLKIVYFVHGFRFNSETTFLKFFF